VYSELYSNISVGRNATVLFGNHASDIGEVIFSFKNCIVTFSEQSVALFLGNKAKNGGVISSMGYLFVGYSVVTFDGNVAGVSGGVIYSMQNSTVEFEGYSLVKFTGNSATHGGASYSESSSALIFGGSSTVK